MGGKAFEGITRRIGQKEIRPTLEWLQEKWPAYVINGQTLESHLLGSAGSLEPDQDAGDLDLNLHGDLYDQVEVAKALVSILGEDHVKARPGNNQIFTAVPIQGDPATGYVQVDFMFGHYDWQKFSYFSAKRADKIQWGGGGKHVSFFKGLYRTEFIKALVAFNSDWVLEENGKMVARVGPTFFHDKGVVWRYRHRPMRKDGKGRVQTLVELDKDEFLKLYPTAVTAKATSMIDPKVVTTLLFDSRTDVDELNTLERIAMNLRRHYDRDQIKKIMEIYFERLNSLKVEIPLDKFRQIWLR